VLDPVGQSGIAAHDKTKGKEKKKKEHRIWPNEKKR
jgi:hypothetical protein